MPEDKIKCPKCGHQIPISEVLQHRLSEQVNAQVENKIEKEKEKLEIAIREKFEKESSDNLKTLKERLTLEAKKREEAEKKELMDKLAKPRRRGLFRLIDVESGSGSRDLAGRQSCKRTNLQSHHKLTSR